MRAKLQRSYAEESAPRERTQEHKIEITDPACILIWLNKKSSMLTLGAWRIFY